MINFNPEPTTSTQPITSEIAQEIYVLIKEFGDVDKAYKMKGNSDYEPEHFAQTNNELERLVGLISTMKSDAYIIEPAYPAEYDEEGNVTAEEVPAVYLDGSSKANLLPYLSSELLDVEVVLNDFYV